MKTKKNKKIYNFTEKQKRKDSHRLFPKKSPIGKELKVWANRKFRKENNIVLTQNLTLEKEVPFKRHRKFLSWWVD